MTPRRSQRIQRVREATPDKEETSERKTRGPRSMAKSRSKLNKTEPAEINVPADKLERKSMIPQEEEKLKQVEISNIVEAAVSLFKSLIASVETDLHFFFVFFSRRQP